MSSKPHPSNPILIVDDEAAILLAIDTALQMAGLSNTLTCQDSRRVMDLLARQPVEVLLLDLTMPHIDGRELLKLAASIPIHTQTQAFPLKQANEALLALKNSEVAGAAVLQCATAL